jgi:hypothetical protein
VVGMRVPTIFRILRHDCETQRSDLGDALCDSFNCTIILTDIQPTSLRDTGKVWETVVLHVFEEEGLSKSIQVSINGSIRSSIDDSRVVHCR